MDVARILCSLSPMMVMVKACLCYWETLFSVENLLQHSHEPHSKDDLSKNAHFSTSSRAMSRTFFHTIRFGVCNFILAESVGSIFHAAFFHSVNYSGLVLESRTTMLFEENGKIAMLKVKEIECRFVNLYKWQLINDDHQTSMLGHECWQPSLLGTPPLISYSIAAIARVILYCFSIHIIIQKKMT